MQSSVTHSELTDTDGYFKYNSLIAKIQFESGYCIQICGKSNDQIELHLERESTITDQVMVSKHIAKVWEHNQ